MQISEYLFPKLEKKTKFSTDQIVRRLLLKFRYCKLIFSFSWSKAINCNWFDSNKWRNSGEKQCRSSTSNGRSCQFNRQIYGHNYEDNNERVILIKYEKIKDNDLCRRRREKNKFESQSFENNDIFHSKYLKFRA